MARVLEKQRDAEKVQKVEKQRRAPEEKRPVATGKATGSERMRKAQEERSVARRTAGSGRERHGVGRYRGSSRREGSLGHRGNGQRGGISQKAEETRPYHYHATGQSATEQSVDKNRRAKDIEGRDRKERAANQILEGVHRTERREQQPERTRQRAERSNGLRRNAAFPSQRPVRAEEQSRRTTQPVMPKGAAQPAPNSKQSDCPPLVRMRDRENALQKERTLEECATQSSKRYRSG